MRSAFVNHQRLQPLEPELRLDPSNLVVGIGEQARPAGLRSAARRRLPELARSVRRAAMPDLPGATPAPFDLDLVGSRYGIPPYRMEELVALRRGGASDATPIAMTAERGRKLLADLARLSV